MQAAERTGKTVVAVEWVGARGLDPALTAVVDFRSFLSDRGVLLNYAQLAGADEFGVSYQRVDLRPAEGSQSFSPPHEQQLLQTNTARPPDSNRDRAFDLYVYDSTDDGAMNYDRVLVVPAPARRRRAGGIPQRRSAGGNAGLRFTEGRRGGGCRPGGRRVGRREGHADRRARGADGRLLPEGDRDRTRPLPIPRLHLAGPRQRELQRLHLRARLCDSRSASPKR